MRWIAEADFSFNQYLLTGDEPTLFHTGDLSADGIPLALRLLLEPMIANALTRPHFIAYDVTSLPRRSVTFWRTVLRCPLVAWTVHSEQHVALCRHLGAGVIFEDIDPPAGTQQPR